MIKKFVEAWDKHKDELKEYIQTHEMREYADDYKGLVRILFEKVINPEMENTFEFKAFDLDDVVLLDDGDYQGTQVFILHEDTYQPDIDDYVYTHVDYGSCSGCDTLLRITLYEEGIPNENQVDDLMLLCLHLLQRCHWMREGKE